MSHASTALPSSLNTTKSLSSQASLPGRRVDGPACCNQPSHVSHDLASLLLNDAVENPSKEAVEHIKLALGFDVLLVSYDPLAKRFRLLADSREIESPRRLSLGDPFEQALSEARLLGRQVVTTGTESPLQPALQQLATYLGSASVSVNLLSDAGNQLQGAILVVGANNDEVNKQLDELTSPLTKYLRLTRTANYSSLHRIWSAAARLGGSSKCRYAAICFAVFIGMMFLPVHYKVKAVCQCEPAGKRIVAAPFEGQLLTAYVKPGDSVEAGQLIAEMDGNELRSQIAASEATLQQARQRHSSAIATGDASVASKELHEITRLRQELAIYSDRQQRLQLLSPINGVVVSGDLEEVQGSSLLIGQGLFEIAPLDKLNAEINIDELDIQHVQADQQATLSFDGDFGNRYEARIARVHPRGEIKDQKNIFVVEASIQEHQTQLAPGMRGQATVYCGWRSLGWVYFHKPYFAWCRFWGWY